MITPYTGAVKVQIIPEMAGIPFGLKYFDDDHTIYVSQAIFDEVVTQKKSLQYVVMAWRKDSIAIHDAVARLHEDVRQYGLETGQLPSGEDVTAI